MGPLPHKSKNIAPCSNLVEEKLRLGEVWNQCCSKSRSRSCSRSVHVLDSTSTKGFVLLGEQDLTTVSFRDIRLAAWFGGSFSTSRVQQQVQYLLVGYGARRSDGIRYSHRSNDQAFHELELWKNFYQRRALHRRNTEWRRRKDLWSGLGRTNIWRRCDRRQVAYIKCKGQIVLPCWWTQKGKTNNLLLNGLITSQDVKSHFASNRSWVP